MITCPNCGAGNKPGSSACRMCATSLKGIAEQALEPERKVIPNTPAAASAHREQREEGELPVEQEGISCPECGTPNEIGWSFCQQCGTKLPSSPPPPPKPADLDARAALKTVPEKKAVIDGSAWKTVPEKRPEFEEVVNAASEEATHQPQPAASQDHSAIQEQSPASEPVPSYLAPTIVVESAPLPKVASPSSAERGKEPDAPAVGPSDPTQHVHSVSGVLCGQCGHSNNTGSAFCASCGAPVTPPKTRVMSSLPSVGAARLHLVMEGGQAGEVYELGDDIVIGRSSGDITFPHDGFMSGRHARIVRRDESFVLVDEGSRNGTFIKIKDEIELRSGDMILVGKQLFRFES